MKVRISVFYHKNTQTISLTAWRRTVVYLCLCLLVCACQLFSIGNIYAQAPKAVAPDDRAPLHVRYPASDQLHDLQTDRDYQYGTDAPPPENPVARLFNWLFRKLAGFLSSNSYQNVWQYVILAAIAGLVIYLLIKAEVLRFLFPKKAQSDRLDYENLAENIHEINFDAVVDEAVNQGNLRLAIRLLYLQTLKRLTDHGLIDYKPDKTNRQYVYELAKSPNQADFEHLTRQFEFVWYGDFSIDDSRFQPIWQQFQAFNRAVASSSPVN